MILPSTQIGITLLLLIIGLVVAFDIKFDPNKRDAYIHFREQRIMQLAKLHQGLSRKNQDEIKIYNSYQEIQK